jgi:hypothetical protein
MTFPGYLHKAMVAGLALGLLAVPAAAEITKIHSQGFIVRHEVVVEADLKQTWLALISPDTWWRKEHTWSGDAANLSIRPSAGGCFCERIPEVDEPGRFTLEGSVEHMRVLQAYPEAALRMSGGLGPLQSEPVNAILTIALSTVDEGTRIVWEYNVAGYMRYEVPVIAKSIDGVIGLQAAALGEVLGPVAGAVSEPANKPDAAKPDAAKPAAAAAEPASVPAARTERAIKVEDVFGDLAGD